MEAWTGRNFYRGGVELNKTILSGIRGPKHFKYKIHSIRRLELSAHDDTIVICLARELNQ